MGGGDWLKKHCLLFVFSFMRHLVLLIFCFGLLQYVEASIEEDCTLRKKSEMGMQVFPTLLLSLTVILSSQLLHLQVLETCDRCKRKGVYQRDKRSSHNDHRNSFQLLGSTLTSCARKWGNIMRNKSTPVSNTLLPLSGVSISPSPPSIKEFPLEYVKEKLP